MDPIQDALSAVSNQEEKITYEPIGKDIPIYPDDVDTAKQVILLNNLGLTYTSESSQVHALEDINLEIKEGEFVCLLGPSGCGKSTLLKIIAGFITPTTGDAYINDDKIKGADWHRGVVFQQPALYPWLTVEENVKFGLKMRGIPKKEQKQIAEYYLEKVGLLEFRKQKPYELSGGMKQRVSIARVLVNNPDVLLMDEPFGALDALTRDQMQNLVRNIWWETHKSILFITHDVDEALSLGTRVVIMSPRPGRIIKEFKTSFTNSITADNADEVRFSTEFKKIREEVLDMINHIRTEYYI